MVYAENIYSEYGTGCAGVGAFGGSDVAAICAGVNLGTVEDGPFVSRLSGTVGVAELVNLRMILRGVWTGAGHEDVGVYGGMWMCQCLFEGGPWVPPHRMVWYRPTVQYRTVLYYALLCFSHSIPVMPMHTPPDMVLT